MLLRMVFRILHASNVFCTYRRVEELLERWVLCNDLVVKALGNVEHLGSNGGGGRDDHINGFLGHGLGESHSFAGSLGLVGEGGDDAFLVQFGGVRVGGDGRLGGRGVEGACAGVSGDGALGFGHLVCFVCRWRDFGNNEGFGIDPGYSVDWKRAEMSEARVKQSVSMSAMSSYKTRTKMTKITKIIKKSHF
jgi:hypothetical protein